MSPLLVEVGEGWSNKNHRDTPTHPGNQGVWEWAMDIPWHQIIFQVHKTISNYCFR